MIELGTLWSVSDVQASAVAGIVAQAIDESKGSSQFGVADLQGMAVSGAIAMGYPVQQIGSVAVISLKGLMLKAYPYKSNYVCSNWHLTQAVKSAHSDDAIESVIILADTPGGSCAGMHHLYDAVKDLASVKTVTVHVQSQLCSAGMFVACGATRIVSDHAMNDVGSIGVRAMLMDFSKYYESLGIEPVVIDTGEFKSIGVEGTEVTDAHKKEIQASVNKQFDAFRNVMKAGRSMSDAQFDAVADGRIWAASDALSLGLIDAVESLEDTLAFHASKSTKNKGSVAKAKQRLKQLA